jgi:hypothetical protein
MGRHTERRASLTLGQIAAVTLAAKMRGVVRQLARTQRQLTRARRGFRPLGKYELLRAGPVARLLQQQGRRKRRSEEEFRHLLPTDPLKEAAEHVENEGPGRQIIQWWMYLPDDLPEPD